MLSLNTSNLQGQSAKCFIEWLFNGKAKIIQDNKLFSCKAEKKCTWNRKLYCESNWCNNKQRDSMK